MGDLEDSLAARFGIRAVELLPQCRVSWDSFDGRVRRSGASLTTHVDGGGTHLQWLGPQGALELSVRGRKPLGLARDLPPGDLRDAASPCLGARKLVPQVELAVRRLCLELLDDEEKVVARVHVEQTTAREADPDMKRLPAADEVDPGLSGWLQLPTLVKLTGLRGYGDHEAAALAMLHAMPGARPTQSDAQSMALASLGLSARHNPTVLTADLKPHVRADVGARRLHSSLLDMLLAHEAGVLEGADTEFLHDFRLAVTRTHTLLQELKDVFPQPLVTHFLSEFAALEDATRPARDGDVFLHHVRSDESLSKSASLRPLFKRAEAMRRNARRRTAATLEAPRFQTLKETWRVFLESPDSSLPLPEQAPNSLRVVAGKRLLRHHRKLLKAQERLNQAKPDRERELGRVLKLTSSMEHLLDCTRPVFEQVSGQDPTRAMALERIVRDVARLQSSLRQWNQVRVHEALLTDIADGMVTDGRANPDTLLGMGRHAEQLRAEGRKALKKASKRLARLCKRTSCERMRLVFSARQAGESAASSQATGEATA